MLDGIPMRNLATFVTTWMEPEAQRVIAENLHRNFIDHAEYPQTAEIEQRCIRMLADLFHAPGETTGARTQGSSEAIMLGALSLKWKWRERREAAGKGHRPAEPRVRRRRARRVGEVLPLLRRRAADHPAAARQVHDRARGRGAPRRREHDRRRRGARDDVHRARRRHRRDQRPARPPARREGARRPAARRRGERRLRVAVPVPRLGVGLPPRAGALDQRVGPQVRARLPGHRLARCSARRATCAEDLVFYENYLGKTRRDVHAELLDGLGDGARPVLQLRPLRARRLPLHHGDDAGERRSAGQADRGHAASSGWWAARARSSCRSSPSSSTGDHNYDEFDVASQLAAERGWMVPAYTLPPERGARQDHARAGQADAQPHAGEHARATTSPRRARRSTKKGGLHEIDRKRVKTGTGY